MRYLVLLLLVATCGSPEPRQTPNAEVPVGAERVPASPDDPAAGMPLTLRSKFEPVAGGPLHAPPPARLDDDGPFVGNDLGPEDYAHLDEQLLAMVGYEGLFATIELERGLFVLRGPGQGGPTDLFLARWEPGRGRLAWIADLAFFHCGDEECARQESWLVDLDDDGRRDVVRRGRIENLVTGEVDDTFGAWRVGADGTLQAIDLPAAERTRYRMEDSG